MRSTHIYAFTIVTVLVSLVVLVVSWTDHSTTEFDRLEANHLTVDGVDVPNVDTYRTRSGQQVVNAPRTHPYYFDLGPATWGPETFSSSSFTSTRGAVKSRLIVSDRYHKATVKTYTERGSHPGIVDFCRLLRLDNGHHVVTFHVESDWGIDLDTFFFVGLGNHYSLREIATNEYDYEGYRMERCLMVEHEGRPMHRRSVEITKTFNITDANRNVWFAIGGVQTDEMTVSGENIRITMNVL